MTDAVRSPGPQELLEIAAVATQYYREGRSKVDIADAMGISRFRVARLLDAALDLGVVRIEIAMPDGINVGLSAELAAAYRLRRAIVIDAPDEPVAELRTGLGRVAANLLPELVRKDDVVGIAWGRTVNAMTVELKRIEPCSIVQLTGALVGSEVNDNAIELVRRMSQISQGAAYPIYAPLLLDDPAVAQSLRGQAQVAEAMRLYERVNVAVIPIGSWHPPDSQIYISVDDAERRELLAYGVRADTSTVMLAADGRILTPPLSDRMIGITGEQLRRVPEVVAVAGGLGKAEAIGVALRARLVTTLITNSTVARELLTRRPAEEA